jgi:hypothetical protein
LACTILAKAMMYLLVPSYLQIYSLYISLDENGTMPGGIVKKWSTSADAERTR